MIEQLKKGTSQLPEWQFREFVCEKINQIIDFLNVQFEPAPTEEDKKEDDKPTA